MQVGCRAAHDPDVFGSPSKEKSIFASNRKTEGVEIGMRYTAGTLSFAIDKGSWKATKVPLVKGREVRFFVKLFCDWTSLKNKKDSGEASIKDRVRLLKLSLSSGNSVAISACICVSRARARV